MAKSKDDIRLFMSPWSPPAWMKQNERMVGTYFPRGLKEGVEYEQAWALYFSKFIAEYKKNVRILLFFLLSLSCRRRSGNQLLGRDDPERAVGAAL